MVCLVDRWNPEDILWLINAYSKSKPFLERNSLISRLELASPANLNKQLFVKMINGKKEIYLFLNDDNSTAKMMKLIANYSFNPSLSLDRKDSAYLNKKILKEYKEKQ